MMPVAPATLYVVATPIGNLADLSPRAQEVLRSVAAICAEDTRHTGQLLSHFSISKPLVALHDRLAEVAGWCEESLETGEVAAVWAVAAPGATTQLRLAAAEAALAFGRLRDAVARLEAVAEAERDDRWRVGVEAE